MYIQFHSYWSDSINIQLHVYNTSFILKLVAAIMDINLFDLGDLSSAQHWFTPTASLKGQNPLPSFN